MDLELCNPSFEGETHYQMCSTTGTQMSDQDVTKSSGEQETAMDESNLSDLKVCLGIGEKMEARLTVDESPGVTVTGSHSSSHSQCIAVQTDFGKQDTETSTVADTKRDLIVLVSLREQLKDSYEEVLDKQTQAEKQLQVQIKQLRQQREEEMQKHKENLSSIQELTMKREETKKRIEKEKKEQNQKEQDLGTDLERLQSRSQQLKHQQEELDNGIATLLAEHVKERKEWDAELSLLKSAEDEITMSMVLETKRAVRAEVLSLESQRDLYLVSLEEAENEAEITLSCLRVATPTLEWIQLKQCWDVRMERIQQMKQNLWEQFDSQIQRVKSGSSLSSLSSISAPNLSPPPSDSNLLQRIALSPLHGPMLQMSSQISEPFIQQTHSQPPLPLIPGFLSGTVSLMPQATTAPHFPVLGDLPMLAGSDKLGKILEKLKARFPQCHKAQLTGIMQQIKMIRGTLAGLTVEELCQMVATQLSDQADFGASVAVLQGNTISQYHALKEATVQGSFSGQTVQHSRLYKLCLICQKLVLPAGLQPMTCNHVMHRECIKFWAQPNQKNSCPFCPSHR